MNILHCINPNQNIGTLSNSYDNLYWLLPLSSKSSGRTISVSFRYKSLRHDWHTGDDKK